MSASNNRTRPAEYGWAGGDQPGELVFAHAAPQIVAEKITEIIQRMAQGKVDVRALAESKTPAGRYCAETKEQAFFVKVSARPGEPSLEKAITKFLESHEIAVAPLLIAGETLVSKHFSYRIDVQPFIPGTHFSGSLDELAIVADALRKCYDALREFPEALQVRAIASARYASLAMVRDKIADAMKRDDFSIFAEQENWARTNTGWLREMAREFSPEFQNLPEAQCLHGQVHPANVLFADGRAVLLDFEESVKTFAPRSWDIAYFVQRFCLRGENPSARFAAVREAYGEPFPQLSMMMRQSAWLSIATLVQQRADGIVAPAAEWEKFVQLERQAVAFADMLDSK